MERQLFAFTARLLILRQEKLRHVGFKRKWALTFAKGNILVSCWFESIAGTWTRSQIRDTLLCSAERHMTHDWFWVADCLLQDIRGCIVLFIYWCMTPFDIHRNVRRSKMQLSNATPLLLFPCGNTLWITILLTISSTLCLKLKYHRFENSQVHLYICSSRLFFSE